MKNPLTEHPEAWANQLRILADQSTAAAAAGDPHQATELLRLVADFVHPGCACLGLARIYVQKITAPIRGDIARTGAFVTPAAFDRTVPGAYTDDRLKTPALQLCAVYANGDEDTCDALLLTALANGILGDLLAFLCGYAGTVLRATRTPGGQS